MQGDKPFEPKAFYQVNLDALVSQDNFYRRLNRELDLHWVRKETKKYFVSDTVKLTQRQLPSFHLYNSQSLLL
jgi:hypothetical protein